MIPSYLLLRQQIENEMGNVERAIARTERSMAGARRHLADQDIYIESAALNLQSVYTGIERIFQLVAERIEQSVPAGEYWHTNLLTQMSLELPDLRPAVIRTTTRDDLDDYRSFRHRIRHVYTYHIDPAKVTALVDRLPDVWAAVKQDLERFLAFLDAVAQAEVEEE
ncbi:MAG TPA: hypothetical protein EYP49_05265 [Anaerolineae bacterium]|nr:hypothetical protein [Anaerolineae bacterium]